MTDHRIDRKPSGVATKATGAKRGGWCPLVWKPIRPTLTLFMTHANNCPACRFARQAAGLPRDGYLHVQLIGDFLTMTEVDDIHRPGNQLVATNWATIGSTQFFRLDGVRTDGGKLLPGAGIVSLGWTDGCRRLTVAGFAEGFRAHGDVIFDAIEDVG